MADKGEEMGAGGGGGGRKRAELWNRDSREQNKK